MMKIYDRVKKADDAEVIDNSKGQLADTVAKMVQLVRQRVEKWNSKFSF